MEYVKIKVDESKAEEIRDFYDVPVNQNPKNEYEYFKAVTPDNVEVTCYRSKKLFTIVFAGDKEAVLDEASIFADNVMLTEKRSNDVGPDYWEDIHTQIGSDEVGIGDFFGGFYVAAVYLSGNDIGLIDKLGIADSKKLTDSKMLEVAPILRQNIKCHVVSASAKKVNELVDKGWSNHKIMANLHNLAHIKLIEKYNLSSDTYIYIDQFEPEQIYKRYLGSSVVKNPLVFQTKGESFYPSIAAASVLARFAFLKDWEQMEKTLGTEIPKGAGIQVDKVFIQLVKKYGLEYMKNYVKTLFRNYKDIANKE